MKKKFLLSLFVALVSLGTWLNVQAAELRGFVKQFTNEQARGLSNSPMVVFQRLSQVGTKLPTSIGLV